MKFLSPVISAGSNEFPQPVNAYGNSGSAVAVTTATANVWTITLSAAAVAITLAGSGPLARESLTLYLTQDATGGRTVTWPATVQWLAGGSPVLNSGPNQLTVVVLETVNGGITWADGQRAVTAAPWVPGDSGFITSSIIPPWQMTGTGTAAAGTIYFFRMAVRVAALISSISIAGTAAGTAGGSPNSYGAYYDPGGNQLAVSAESSSVFAAAPVSGLFTVAMGTAFTPSTSWIWGALLFNMSAYPTLYSTGGASTARTYANIGLSSAATAYFPTSASGKTAMPSGTPAFTPSTYLNNTSGQPFLVVAT